MTNQAAVIKYAKARLTIENRPIPKLGQGEILVRNAALAINPADWKMQDSGFAIDKYPTVLGSDVAGTIEDVGPGVHRFQKGDRVTGFADVLGSKNPDHAAFQQYTVLGAQAAAKLPSSMTFEEGAMLPMSVATAGGGLFFSLGIPLPPARQQGGFLVWGASSSVGSAVVQIAASIGYTVYATCSPRHSEYVKKLGAHETFDYSDPSVVNKIAQSVKIAGREIHVGYDAISASNSSPQCAEIIASFGKGKLCIVGPFPEDIKKPADLETVFVMAALVALDKDHGTWLFNDWLEKSLNDKSFVPSPAIEKVDGGIAALQEALNLQKRGVSGKKLVLKL